MRSRIQKYVLGLLIGCTVTTTFANIQRCEYVEGKLLAKFKAGITVNDGATPTTTGIATLNELNSTYRCSKLEPLLPHTKHRK